MGVYSKVSRWRSERNERIKKQKAARHQPSEAADEPEAVLESVDIENKEEEVFAKVSSEETKEEEEEEQNEEAVIVVEEEEEDPCADFNRALDHCLSLPVVV